VFNQIIQRDIQQAVALLRAGKLVAFPTETVYGLGADASNPTAVAKIFAAKGRPADHPVIVHLAHRDQLKEWARDISPLAWQLAEHFWPGPLTLILPKAHHVPTIITGGQDSIGLRVPNHPIAQALLQAFAGGIAAPSANRFGHISPTLASHVRQDLGAAVDLILDGDDCPIGIESTIVDVSGGAAVILRPGAITASQINAVLGNRVASVDKSTVRASGMLLKHYSPQTALQLIDSALLEPTLKQKLAQGLTVAVLARYSVVMTDKHLRWINMPIDAIPYAHELYSRLHEIDLMNVELILVEDVPEDETWLAIRDRLQKAAGNLKISYNKD